MVPPYGPCSVVAVRELSRLSRLCSPPVPGTECPVSPENEGGRDSQVRAGEGSNLGLAQAAVSLRVTRGVYFARTVPNQCPQTPSPRRQVHRRPLSRCRGSKWQRAKSAKSAWCSFSPFRMGATAGKWRQVLWLQTPAHQPKLGTIRTVCATRYSGYACTTSATTTELVLLLRILGQVGCGEKGEARLRPD